MCGWLCPHNDMCFYIQLVTILVWLWSVALRMCFHYFVCVCVHVAWGGWDKSF